MFMSSPLDAAALGAALAGYYPQLDVTDSTGSTNADLLAAAGLGAPDRTVLIAEAQTDGRGRRARRWVSPPGTGLYLSVLLRPSQVAAPALGTLSMVAGLALAEAVRETAGVTADLKWPNDLLIDGAKCAGILCEVGGGTPPAVVVGIGLNTGPLGEEVPAGAGGLPATSLADAGATETDRSAILVALLVEFAELEARWRSAGGSLAASGLLRSYRELCSTLGADVRVELPDGSTRTGVGRDIDADGRLLVTGDDGVSFAVSAGDVVHVRH
ncbi:BirA family biotin operon repressor/biotin-[acetyl-CoA-carboxylase] ligase [Labedaea rhizosphaerae]|uniref:biotin--[biotin carboxyl-carrier protein] ligase n=2 Tax=Labedaea rhizosphaerae TaxID=598644 RepID=A0A4R6S4I6_LABRH|nr:BirA family biotin operon repressor/biotin-[acetyl-CoA-carboxylase] ligase [Labedaea rhizosphaerae]